jgi:hypothetical protein
MRVQVTVVHPTLREDDTPAQLDHWRLAYKAAPASEWTPVGGNIALDITQRIVDNVSQGTWDWQAIWTDTDGQDSVPAMTVLAIGPPAKPRAGSLVAVVVP